VPSSQPPPAIDLPTPALPDERSRNVLDLVHRLLTMSPSTPRRLEEVLADLARAFAAAGAGLGRLHDGLPVVRQRIETAGTDSPMSGPWETRPELLAQLAAVPTPLPITGAADTTWLLTAVLSMGRPAWLLWLEDAPGRSWSAAEQAALTLAGQAVARTAATDPVWARPLEQAARQQRLEESAPVMQRLVHDFGNVLTSLLGFSELALEQVSPEHPLFRHLEEIYRSSQEGARLTNQLRLACRRGAVKPCLGSPAAVAVETTARLLREWPAGVHLQNLIAPDVPAVAADGELLAQLLGHLLDNAREALTGAGTVILAARSVELTAAACLELFGKPAAGPCLEITVSDSGCGLAPEVQRNLLATPFFTTKPGHRGLGLAVVHGIVSMHRGGWCLVPGRDGGAVACVYLPLAGHGPRASSRTPTGREKVLVVDDDPAILQLVCATLERDGYRVQTAASGTEALEKYVAANERFRLVLSDVIMPRMNGVDLARQLQHLDVGINLLFMSGHASPEMAGAPLAVADIPLLQKPFRPEGLLRAVRTALDRAPATPARALSPPGPVGARAVPSPRASQHKE
jgi:signal transduction histidine kinase/ActR/RegA family two-component response regulator